MTGPAEIALKEYEIVRATLAERAARIQTVKSWGITLAAAGLAAAAQIQSVTVLLLVSAASLAFWMLEAGLHGGQRIFNQRARQIELFLSAGAVDQAFRTPWISHHRAASNRVVNAFRSAFLPHVFLPNGLIAIAGPVVVYSGVALPTF